MTPWCIIADRKTGRLMVTQTSPIRLAQQTEAVQVKAHTLKTFCWAPSLEEAANIARVRFQEQQHG